MGMDTGIDTAAETQAASLSTSTEISQSQTRQDLGYTSFQPQEMSGLLIYSL